ncbi:MAG TPA: hypothetical protein VK922_15180 [Gemmatimonadaceae bacterium]|nr:hypothetical protein [Gemmatimonadaceae bacterium]
MTKDPKDPKVPEKTVEPKKGGFGAFADKYRDRWEANHPSAKKEDRGATPSPASPHETPDAPPTDHTRPASP